MDFQQAVSVIEEILQDTGTIIMPERYDYRCKKT